MAYAPESTTATFDIQDDFQTTLSGAVTASDTAIPLTLLPTITEGTLVIDPDTASEEEIYFTSAGGGNVNVPSASAGRGVNGTATSHSSGATVKLLPTAAQFQALKKGGAFSTGTSSVGIRAAAVRQEAWTTWSPTYSASGSMTFGTVSTNVARYQRVGNTVHFQISATGTTGGTQSASIRFTLPLTMNNSNWATGCRVNEGTNIGLAYPNSTTVMNVDLSGGSNWTLNSGRFFAVSGTYECA